LVDVVIGFVAKRQTKTANDSLKQGFQTPTGVSNSNRGFKLQQGFQTPTGV